MLKTVRDTYPVSTFGTYLTVVADEPNSGVGDGENDMRYFTLRHTSRLEVHKTTPNL